MNRYVRVWVAALALCFGACSSLPPVQDRIASTAFTDGAGRVWDADRAYGTTGPWGYTAGKAVSSTTAVANTTDDPLYQKYRELAGEYRFQVPNGSYQVTLKFAEFSLSLIHISEPTRPY